MTLSVWICDRVRDDINGFSSGTDFFSPLQHIRVDITILFFFFFLSLAHQHQQIVLILINDSRDVVKSGSWVYAGERGGGISIINILPFVGEL